MADGHRAKVRGLTAEQRANRIVLEAARHAYTDQEYEPRTIPVDTRCPSCGLDRESCDRPLCIRLMSENEE